MARTATIGAVLAGSALLAALGFFAYVLQSGAPTDDVEEPSTPVHSPAPEPAPTAATVAGQSFVDDWGGYRLSLPEGWRVRDRTAATHMIRADVTHGDAGFQIRVLSNVHTDDPEAFTTRYVDGFVRDMQSHWGGTVERGDVVCGPTGESTACRVSLRQDRRDGASYWLGQYLWLRGRTAVVFQAGAPSATATTAKSDIDRIASSFAWTP